MLSGSRLRLQLFHNCTLQHCCAFGTGDSQGEEQNATDCAPVNNLLLFSLSFLKGLGEHGVPMELLLNHSLLQGTASEGNPVNLKAVVIKSLFGE